MLPGRDNIPGFANGPLRQRPSSGGGQFSKMYAERMAKYAASAKYQSRGSGVDGFLSIMICFGLIAGIMFLIYAAVEWLHIDVLLKPLFQNLGKVAGWLFGILSFLLSLLVGVFMWLVIAITYGIIVVGNLINEILKLL